MQSKPVAGELTQTSDILAMPLVKNMAAKFEIEPARMLQTLKATVFRIKAKGDKPAPEISNEQLIMLMAVAKKYDLDPFTKEIYAFPSDGGISAIVPIDGWAKIINNHPQLGGVHHHSQRPQ
jgi:RecT family